MKLFNVIAHSHVSLTFNNSVREDVLTWLYVECGHAKLQYQVLSTDMYCDTVRVILYSRSCITRTHILPHTLSMHLPLEKQMLCITLRLVYYINNTICKQMFICLM